MLSPIQFDDDLFLERNEIHDVVSERHLPPELGIFQLPGSQLSPKEFLCAGLPFSEVPGIHGKSGLVHGSPSPFPSPVKGEGDQGDPLPPEKS